MRPMAASLTHENDNSMAVNSSTRASRASLFSSLFRSRALLCSMALVVCALTSRPFVEMGVNDDWSYIRSALHLAQTGQIAYFGWTSPIIGWQLYLGALFIKLFGFSFSAVRFSGLLVAAAALYFLHRILVQCGISETNATIGTLTFALSPLFLLLAFSFMTDVPGLFSLLLCIYLCLRSLHAVADASATNWLIFAMASNLISGFVRQTSWLGVIVIVPSTFWLLRNRRLSRVKVGLFWLISLLCIFASIRWYQHQPFSLPRSPIDAIRNHQPVVQTIKNVSDFALCIPQFLLPVLASFITPAWVQTRRTRLAVSIAIAILIAVILASLYAYLRFHMHHILIFELAPWGYNYFTS